MSTRTLMQTKNKPHFSTEHCPILKTSCF